MNERRKKYLAAMLLLVAAISGYGIATMQYFLATMVVVFVVVPAFILVEIYTYFSDGHGLAFRSDASTALFVAVFVAYFGMTFAPWVVWAVALMALFLILQSVIRIERQRMLPEKSDGDPGPEPREE